MSNPELKIANFERMVIGEAQQRRDKSLEDISREKEKALAKIKKELNEEAQRKYKSETKKLTKAKNERVFQKQLECKREILEERQRLVDMLFESVLRRLTAFVDSADYERYIDECLLKSRKRLEEATLIQIVRHDEKFEDKFKSMGLKVEYIDKPIIGGFILIDEKNSVRIDETLFVKVEQSKAEFLRRYNLKI